MNDEKRSRLQKQLIIWAITAILIGVALMLAGYPVRNARIPGWQYVGISGMVLILAGLLTIGVLTGRHEPEYLKQPYEPPHVEFEEAGWFAVIGGSLTVANPPMSDWRRQAITAPFPNGESSVRLEAWWPSDVRIVAVEVTTGVVSGVLSTEKHSLLTEIGHVVVADSEFLETEDVFLREVERADAAARKGSGWAFLCDLSGRRRGILTTMPAEEDYEVVVTRGSQDGVRVTCTNLSAKDDEEAQAAME